MVDVWGGRSGGTRDVWGGSSRPSSQGLSRLQPRGSGGSAGVGPLQPYQQWLNRQLSESSDIRRTGGESGAVERAEAISGYQPPSFLARQAGLPRAAKNDEGIFSTIFDYLTRASSAAVGFATGASGQTRYQVGQAPETVRAGEYIETALRRAKEGWAGDQYYTFSDFGNIAKKKSEGQSLDGWETALNFGRGLVLDTLVDPLTYVSFGGSIMGRIGSMGIVRGRARTALLKNISSPTFKPREFFINTIEREMAPVSIRGGATRMQQYFINAAAKTTNERLQNFYKATDFIGVTDQTGRVTAEALANAVEERIQVARRIAMEETARLGKQVDPVDFSPFMLFAEKQIPNIAAWYYILRGSGGTRKWAQEIFGNKQGWDYFNSLPIDVQGGLRVRVPFLRHRGSPIAARIPGIGGGKLSDRFAKVGIPLGKAVEFTNQGRDLIRQMTLSVGGDIMTSLLYKGRWGAELASALVGATGRKLYFKGIPRLGKHFKGIPRLGKRSTKFGDEAFSDFLDYSDHLDSVFEGTQKASMFMSAKAEHRIAIATAMNRAFELLKEAGTDSKEARRELVENFWDLLGERERLSTILDQIASSPVEKNAPLDELEMLFESSQLQDFLAAGFTEMEYYASIPAFIAANYFDSYGRTFVEATGNSRKAQHMLNNYAPRRRRERAALQQYYESFRVGEGLVGAGSQNLKQRYRDVEWWQLLPDGEAFAVKYYGPHQIYKSIGEKYDTIYLDDPLAVIKDYSDAMDRTLADLYVIEGMRMSGSLTQARARAFDSFDLDYMEENLVELLGGVEQAAAGGSAAAARYMELNKINPGQAVGEVRKLRDEIIERFGFSGDPATLAQEIRDLDALDLYALSEILSNRMPGLGITKYNEINLYQKVKDFVPDDEFEEIFVNQYDLTQIKLDKMNNYRLFDANGNPIIDPETGSQVISKQMEDVTLKAGYILQMERMVLWNNYTAMRSIGAMREIESLIYRTPEGAYSFINELRNLTARYHEGKMSKGLYDQAYAAYLSKMEDILRLFGREGKVILDPETKVVKWVGFKKLDFDVKANLRELWEREGLYNMNMLSATDIEGGASAYSKKKREVQTRVIEYLGEVYAPRATMEAITRAFQVLDTTQGMGRFYAEFYQPFYAMIRSMLTLGGGPGFVLRNVRGGMWNNYILGVTIQHNKASVALLNAKRQARRNVVKRLEAGENLVGKEDEIFEDFLRIIRKDYKGTGTFIDGMKDADALAEIYTLAYDANIIGARAGRVVDFLYYDDGARGVQFSAVKSKDRREIFEKYAENAKDAGTLLDKSLNAWGKLNNRIAYNNPVIRGVMSPMAEASENYLRLAAFIKGVQEMGLEPAESGIRGMAASAWVKATQFDYADLSFWEQHLFRNIMPFYIWMRNNVPLQLRAFIHQPQHVAQAARVYQGLVRMFGDDDGERSPDYLSDSLAFEIDKSRFDWLPQAMQPNHDISLGLLWGDPLIDSNQLLRIPGGDRGLSPVRGRNLVQNINPLISGVLNFLSRAVTPSGPDYTFFGDDEQSRTEPAFWQAPYLPWNKDARIAIPGVGGYDAGDEEFYGNDRIRKFITTIFPPLQRLERLTPLGDPRQQNRLLTAWASWLFGLPVNTIDNNQVAAQLRRDTQEYEDMLEEMFGPTADTRVAMVDMLMKEGTAAGAQSDVIDFLNALDISQLPADEVDVEAAKHAFNLYRIVNSQIESGVPAEEVLMAMWGVSPEGSEAQAIVEIIWDNVRRLAVQGRGTVRYRDPDTGNAVRITSDEFLLKNMFEIEDPTEEELEQLGYTPFDIADMTPEQRLEVRRAVQRLRRDG